MRAYEKGKVSRCAIRLAAVTMLAVGGSTAGANVDIGLIGAMGDSYTSEYDFISRYNEHNNWLEHLASNLIAPTGKDSAFGDYRPGTGSSNWDFHRLRGYEYNWGRGGAGSYDARGEEFDGKTTNFIRQANEIGRFDQLTGVPNDSNSPGLLGQVQTEGVGKAAVFIGFNSFGFSRYDAIYNGNDIDLSDDVPAGGAGTGHNNSGFLGEADGTFTVTQFRTEIVNDIEQSVNELIAAGLGPQDIVVFNIPDWSATPQKINDLSYSDPAKRQRVTDAISAANDDLADRMTTKGVTVIDAFALSRITAPDMVPFFEGTDMDFTLPASPGNDQPITEWWADAVHGGHIWHGAMANLALLGWGVDEANLLTPDQILAGFEGSVAGLTVNQSFNSEFNYGSYLIVPEPGVATLLVSLGMLGMVRRPKRHQR